MSNANPVNSLLRVHFIIQDQSYPSVHATLNHTNLWNKENYSSNSVNKRNNYINFISFSSVFVVRSNGCLRRVFIACVYWIYFEINKAIASLNYLIIDPCLSARLTKETKSTNQSTSCGTIKSHYAKETNLPSQICPVDRSCFYMSVTYQLFLVIQYYQLTHQLLNPFSWRIKSFLAFFLPFPNEN